MINPVELILSALAVLITLSIHEYAHAYAAHKLGDDTAKNMGRLTLNPLKHLDPIGAICMLLFKIGWAKPVPINARNFKDPKKGFALSALAGPLVNLIIAFLFSGIYLFSYYALSDVMFEPDSFSLNLARNGLIFLQIFFSVNLGLGIFNLLPIPPFDGSRLLNVIFPPKIYFEIMKYERQIYFGVLAWLLLGDYAAYGIRSLPFVASNPLLYSAAGILSLSDMIAIAIDFVGNLMLDFWLLIIPL
jgi:Zn-dependent protease